jgi:hypothetical protein
MQKFKFENERAPNEQARNPNFECKSSNLKMSGHQMSRREIQTLNAKFKFENERAPNARVRNSNLRVRGETSMNTCGLQDTYGAGAAQLENERARNPNFECKVRIWK